MSFAGRTANLSGRGSRNCPKGLPVTELMAYFETDRTDPSARTILYPDFPVTLLGTERKNRGRDVNEVLPRTLVTVKWSVIYLDTSLLFP